MGSMEWKGRRRSQFFNQWSDAWNRDGENARQPKRSLNVPSASSSSASWPESSQPPKGTKIAAELRSAKSAEEALRIAERHREELDGWDLTICVSRVANENPGFNERSASTSDWTTWEWILKELAATVHKLSPRGLATLAVSLSKLKSSPRSELLQALEERATSDDLQFDSQSLAGFLWGMSNNPNWKATDTAVRSLLGKAKGLRRTRPKDQKQTVLALSKLGVSSADLEVLKFNSNRNGGPSKRSVKSTSQSFGTRNSEPTNLDNKAIAERKARTPAPWEDINGLPQQGDAREMLLTTSRDVTRALELVSDDPRMVLEVIEKAIPESINPENIALALTFLARPRPYGMGKGRVTTGMRQGWNTLRDLLPIALLEAELPVLIQMMTSLAWLRYRPSLDVMRTIAQRLQGSMLDIDGKDLVKILRSLTALGKVSPRLSQAASERLLQISDELSPEDIVSCIRSISATGYNPPKTLFTRLSALAHETCTKLPLGNLRNLLIGIHKLEGDNEFPETKSLCVEVEKRLEISGPAQEDCSAETAAELIWTLAHVRYSPCPLTIGLMDNRVASDVHKLSARAAANVLWAHARMSHRGSIELMRAVQRHLILRRDELTPAMVGTLLWSLGKLGYQAASTELLEICEQVLSKASSRELDSYTVSQSIWGWASLSHVPDENLLTALEEQAMIQLPKLTSQAMANTLWGFARMTHVSKRELLVATEEQATRRMTQFSPQNIANLLWAFGRVEHQPGMHFLKEVESRSYGVRDQFSARDISNTIWSFAKLAHMPDLSLIRGMEAQAIKLFPRQFSPPYISNLLWGFAKLGFQPQQSTFDALKEIIGRQLKSFSGSGLCSVLWAIVRLRYDEDKDFVRKVANQVTQEVESLDSVEVANVLWALPRLGMHPSDETMKALENQAMSQISDFKAQSVAMALSAFAKLHYPPKTQLMRAFEQHAYAEIDLFDSQAIANLFWAYAKLSYKPGLDLMNSLEITIQRQIHTFNSQGIANMLWAMGKLQHTPGPDVTKILISRIQTLVDEFSPQGIANTIHGLAKLQIQPPSSLLAAFERRAVSKITDFSPQSVAISLTAFRKLNHPLSKRSLDTFQRRAATLAHNTRPMERSTILGSLDKMGVIPLRELLHSYETATNRAVRQSNEEEVLQLLWAFARLGHKPQSGLFSAIEDALSRNTNSFAHEEITGIWWAFARINVQPSIELLRKLAQRTLELLGFLTERERSDILSSLGVLKKAELKELEIALLSQPGAGARAYVQI